MASLCLPHQRGGRRPEGTSRRKGFQSLESRLEVRETGCVRDVPNVLHALEGRGQQAVDQFHGEPPGSAPDAFVGVGVHDVVDAWTPLHRPRLPAADMAPQSGLQLQSYMLYDVAEPRSLAQTPDESSGLAVRATMIAKAREE